MTRKDVPGSSRRALSGQVPGWFSCGAAAVLALAGCSFGGAPKQVLQAVPRTTLAPPFAPYGGTLVASRTGDGLCLDAFFDGPKPGSGGCGFTDAPASGRFIYGATDAGDAYAFGPVPSAVTTVRATVAPGRTKDVPTAALPSNLATGRYFFTAVSESTDADPVFLDANGDRVAPQDF